MAQVADTHAPGAWSPERHCYLCGQPLGDNYNADHVPPRRIFPSQIRRDLKENLLTLKTHPSCQKAYQKDEEYFFNTLLPNALPSAVGPMLAKDFKALIERDKPSRKLSGTILRQFEERPGGLVLPHGLIVQRLQPGRVDRIVWKIVRGLHSHETGNFLSEQQPRAIEIYGPFDHREIPDYIDALRRQQPKGHTPTCFEYTLVDFSRLPGWNGPPLHAALITLWQSYLIFQGFHDPSCACDKCKQVS
jgi:hypothetical protein